MKNIKLIVSDLDNTLLTSKGTLTDYTIRILASCRQKGIMTAFATARPERMTMSVQSRFSPDYVIADNGAMIFESGKIIKKSFLPTQSMNRLIRELTKHKEIQQICVDIVDACYCNYDDSEQMREFWSKWNVIFNDYKNDVLVDSTKISVECTNEELFCSILQSFSDFSFCANSGENWFQVMCKTVSKLNAVKYLCQRLGLQLADVACFGDDYNDLDMLRHCGVGVAVANSDINIKGQAKYICDTNENDGVAKWIEDNIVN